MAEVTGLKDPNVREERVVKTVPELAAELDELLDYLEGRDADFTDAIEALGGTVSGAVFRLTSYESTAVYPTRVEIQQWLDCTTDTGGEIRLPLSADLQVGQSCAVCRAYGSGEAISVVTTDSKQINGAVLFDISTPYEHYIFFWTGSEWRVRS